jgi:hypothetical protein
MPSRNMIAANVTIFEAIDEYCRRRGDVLGTANHPRWINTTSQERGALKHAKLTSKVSLSASIKLARFDLYNRIYFLTSGLDTLDVPNELQVEDINAGLVTAFLSELQPTPIASFAKVRDIVDVESKTTSQFYNGHRASAMAELYPRIQIFSAHALGLDESLKVFFLLCLDDRRRTEQWIDADLAQNLRTIALLNPAALPYRILYGPLLEIDPASLFLALYRCLEAVYAYTHTKDLACQLHLAIPWTELAQTLEEVLAWYPREEPSLEALLYHSIPDDLDAVLDALKEAPDPNARKEALVARRVYSLRNALVHYRPFHQSVSFERIDWNRLCEAMALLVFHTYSSIN